MSSGFQRTDHTSDEGIRVWGSTGKELFEEAAKGLISVLVDRNTVESKEVLRLNIMSENVEGLFLQWLREILYLVETEGMVFSRFQIEKDNISLRNAESFFLSASIGGEKINPLRHGICKEIKSVTRHGFYIKKGNPWWEANILFDV